MSEPIKAVEESPGVVSMMRWGLRATIYIYGGTALLVAGTWATNAIMVIINGTGDFHWIPGISIMTAAGAMKGMTEFVKHLQKKTEVKAEIEETIAKSAHDLSTQ